VVLMRLTAIAAVVGLAALATADTLVPPLDPAPLLPDLANAIRRRDVLDRATAADAARIQDAFLAGSWAAFETWAQLVLAGRAPRVASVPATPHGQFWAGVVARPVAERDAWLAFLLRARQLHAGLSDKLARPDLPACSAKCGQLVVDYLAAFIDPRHATDPKQPLGPELHARASYPDEAMVGLAGDLSLAAAVPHLERLVAAERRFYQLYTDYSTSPEEVGGVFGEALRALVKLARGDAAVARDVRATLAKTTPDRIWFETYSDGGRQGPPQTSVVERDADDRTAKRPWLARAVHAIDGDAHAIAELSERVPVFPTATWIDRIDVSSAAEGRGGKLWLDGTTLVALDQTALVALDTRSGNRLYDASFAGVAATGGIQGWATTFAPTRTGIVAPVWVRPTQVKAPDELRLCAFDVATGELARAPAVRATLTANGAPDYFAAAGDHLWYREGDRALELDRDGKVDATRVVAAGESLRAVGDKLALYKDDHVTIEVGGRVVIDRDAAGLVGGHDHPVIDAIVLRDRDFLLSARYQTIYSIDYAGGLRWRADLPDAWAAPGPQPCDGDRVCVHTAKQLFVLDAGGRRVADVALPANTSEVVVARGRAYALTDHTLSALPLVGGAPTVVVDHLDAMAHVIAVTDRCALVAFYESGAHAGDPTGWFLGCFPP
jgi:hypothetical protein